MSTGRGNKEKVNNTSMHITKCAIYLLFGSMRKNLDSVAQKFILLINYLHKFKKL